MGTEEVAAAMAKINREIDEPIAPPRRTKVRKLPKHPEMRVLKDTGVTLVEENFLPEENPSKRTARSVKKLPRRNAVAESPERYITLWYLVQQLDIDEQLARKRLRAEGIKRPGTRWRWLEGSAELRRVKRVLRVK
jgi:hypothetical protein